MKKIRKYLLIILVVFTLTLFNNKFVGATGETFVPVLENDNIGGKLIKFQGGTFSITSDDFNTLKTSSCISFESHSGYDVTSPTTTSFNLTPVSSDISDSFNNVSLAFSYSGTTLTVTATSTESFAYNETEDTVISDLGALADLNINVLYVEETTASLNPTFSGNTAIVTSVDDPISVDRIKASLTAFDNEDGDISDSIAVKTDNYTASATTCGNYTVIFTVKDSSNNSTDCTITVNVRDITKPIITGPTSYNAKISVLTSAETIKSLLIVTDNYTNNEDIVISVKTNGYQSNYNKVGIYQIIYEAKDEAGNTETYTVDVNVKDDIIPTFTGPLTILKASSEILTLNDIKSRLSASDNVDGNITSRIAMVTDNYSGHGASCGTYTIDFIVSDTQNNEATHTITITVNDDIPPVFFVDNYFIQVSELTTLTNDQIIELLVASGQIETTANRTIRFMVNNYSGNEDMVGQYPVTLSVRSNNGEEDVINLAVQVVEDDSSETDINLEADNNFSDWLVKKDLLIANWIWLLIIISIIIVIIVKKKKRY